MAPDRPHPGLPEVDLSATWSALQVLPELFQLRCNCNPVAWTCEGIRLGNLETIKV